MINTITINNKEIPLTCPECGGSGCINNPPPFQRSRNICPFCQGTGQKYYTPQELEEITGEKLPDDTAVYWITGSKRLRHIIDNMKYVEIRDIVKDTERGGDYFIINFPYQPTPPADYRHKE